MQITLLARSWRFLLLLLGVILLSFTSLSYAAQVTLAWDSSISSNVIGYKLYWGSASGQYTNTVNVGDVLEYTLDIPNETYIAVTAYNDETLESDYSNEVIYFAQMQPATEGNITYEEQQLMARIWDEKLEADPGYDEVWNQGETASEGCTVDEDYDTVNVGSPVGWGSDCLRCDTDNDNENAYVQHNFAGESDAWARIEAYIISEGLANSEITQILFARDATNAKPLYRLYLVQLGTGALKWMLRVYLDGTNISDFYSDNAINIGTVYRIEVEWDVTNDSFDWEIDGVNQGNQSALAAEHGTNFEWFRLGLIGGSGEQLAEICYDLIAIDDADWVGAEGVGAVAPTAALYGPLVGPMGGPI